MTLLLDQDDAEELARLVRFLRIERGDRIVGVTVLREDGRLLDIKIP